LASFYHSFSLSIDMLCEALCLLAYSIERLDFFISIEHMYINSCLVSNRLCAPRGIQAAVH